MDKLFISKEGWIKYDNGVQSVVFELINGSEISGAIMKGNRLILELKAVYEIFEELKKRDKNAPIYIIFHNSNIGYAAKNQMPVKKFNIKKLEGFMEYSSTKIQVVMKKDGGWIIINIKGPHSIEDFKKTLKNKRR